MSKWKKIKICRRKVRHTYFDEASKELFRMKQRLARKDFLCIYHCLECRGWHIGNSISIGSAKKSLKALEDKMAQAGFARHAPRWVQNSCRERRIKLMQYLLQRIDDL